MRELPLRVAVLSPQAIVAEGLRAILATLREHAELVPLDSQAADPDVVLYDAIGLLRGDATDLDILVNKTTSTVLVVSHDLRPGLAAEALAAGADGHISLAAGPAEILAALDSAATGWRLGDDGDSPVIGSEDSETGRDLLGGSLGLSRREAQMLTLIGDRVVELRDRRGALPQPQHRQDLHPGRLPQDRCHQPGPGDLVGDHARVRGRLTARPPARARGPLNRAVGWPAPGPPRGLPRGPGRARRASPGTGRWRRR